MGIKKFKSVAYSSQVSHTGQLDFCNWLADGSTMNDTNSNSNSSNNNNNNINNNNNNTN